MKTKNFTFKIAVTALVLLLISNMAESQTRVKIGIISIDTQGLNVENQTMTSLVHLELEKANVYEVLDRYDLADMVRKEGIDVNECFGKSCLVKIGSLLGADKMLSGSVEKHGNKIIIIFRLIDVKTDRIVKTDVMEYIDQQDQLQAMVRMSINNILGIENDKFLLDLLVNYDLPITTARTSLSLNGPRVGFTYATGVLADRMTGSRTDGGFGMFPVSNIMGYQFEKQFLSAGDFQALFEVLPMVSGLESGMFIPSVTTMIGFRFNKSGIEFGLGPTFRINKMAKGAYIDEKWILEKDATDEQLAENDFYDMIDSRGSYKFSTAMIFAVGKTFRSGYLNMPVNVYVSPHRDGYIFGIMVGFNVAKSPLVVKTSEK